MEIVGASFFGVTLIIIVRMVPLWPDDAGGTPSSVTGEKRRRGRRKKERERERNKINKMKKKKKERKKSVNNREEQ